MNEDIGGWTLPGKGVSWSRRGVSKWSLVVSSSAAFGLVGGMTGRGVIPMS